MQRCNELTQLTQLTHLLSHLSSEAARFWASQDRANWGIVQAETNLLRRETMRVLIATATAGAGHLAAAAALDEAWRSSRPEDVVEKVDLVKFFSALHRKIHADGYLKIVEHAPEIWGMVFKKTDNLQLARRLNRFKRVFPSNSRLRFARFVKEFRPDAVLCTHYLPLETLAHLKRGRLRGLRRGTGARTTRGAANSEMAGGDSSGPLVVSIVTDFEAHALWM